jgi:hypothetical protein
MSQQETQPGAQASSPLGERYLKRLVGQELYERLRASGGPMTMEKVIESLPVRDARGEAADEPTGVLATLACDLLAGRPVDDRDIPEDERFNFLNGWLRFVTGTSPLAQMRWQALVESRHPELADRDAYALTLWRRIERGAGDARAETGHFIAYVERNWCPWSYYERRFFAWFLSRFNLGAARRMFGGSRMAAPYNALVLVGAVGLACLALGPPLSFTRSLALAGLAAALLVGSFRLLRLDFHVHLSSLIPRLAAAVGIGYLFLTSASQLLGQIHNAPRRGWLWLTSAALLATAYSYIAIHIWRRVHPPLRTGALLWRSLDVWLLALSFSALGLMLAAPVLFGSVTPGVAPAAATPERLALCAAIALNLGVILQLAWDEKPLTEPL